MVADRLTLLFSCAAFVAAAQDASSALEAHLAAAREAQAHTNCHLAAQEYRAAAALMPGSGELRTNEAIALYCDQQFGAAVTALHTALLLNPALATPRLFLGLASYRLGDLPEAQRGADHGRRNAPPEAYLLLAQVSLQQGQAKDAVPLPQRYLTFNPGASTAFYYLSRAYRVLGDRSATAQALTDYKRTSEDAKSRALLAPVIGGAAATSFPETKPEFPERSGPPAPPASSQTTHGSTGNL